jgi:hypothetical protein
MTMRMLSNVCTSTKLDAYTVEHVITQCYHNEVNNGTGNPNMNLAVSLLFENYPRAARPSSDSFYYHFYFYKRSAFIKAAKPRRGWFVAFVNCCYQLILYIDANSVLLRGHVLATSYIFQWMTPTNFHFKRQNVFYVISF